jgi:hypothetical protein
MNEIIVIITVIIVSMSSDVKKTNCIAINDKIAV